ncbi:hypothetical protein EYR40_008080 [Pleurotus pulmonarius]|nr:hypothetical protein EYR38_007611 [Pleurotus pulmonarius]KAF4597618.1 hypothetical protein EYR40_008080 [Pleurotus pulmonarius]
MTSTDDLEFKPSKLGTKDHWDKVYETELVNFEEIGDEGEVWFGQDSVEKMVDWALARVPPSEGTSILEIGSGNGTLLVALAEAGYPTSRLCGIDYSSDAVKLSKAVAASRGTQGISFAECNFLSEDPPRLVPDDGGDGWGVMMDKGTFDAIALAPPDDDGKPLIEGYPSRVSQLLRSGGYFLITSCNFTEEELKARFITPMTGLTYHSSIKYPVFSFGGQRGSSYASVAFQKS